MQYLVLKFIANRYWKPIAIVNARRQITAINKVKKNNNGKLWIFPLNHSTFYDVKNKKIISKKRFYE